MSVRLCRPAFVYTGVCVCVQILGRGVCEGCVCGPKGDVGTNESTGAAVVVCLL